MGEAVSYQQLFPAGLQPAGTADSLPVRPAGGQEREAFDLNRGQSIGWFRLQMSTGRIVLGLLVVVALLSAG